MYGEHVLELRQSCPTVGSSPHVRGARLLSKVMPSITGIIPACAGSTCTVFVYGRSYWDHPRMCGEHAPSCSPYPKTAGSSPHVRGAPSASRCGFHVPGIIPACAGSTMAYRPSSPPTRDHPRMCGEHMPVRMTVKPFEGSSPHVRGALSGRCGRCRPIGIIPACAGSTPTSKPIACNERDHPRMCGEHEALQCLHARRRGSSPHVRGAHQARRTQHEIPGIIPACAGSTSSDVTLLHPIRDHPPHVRGARHPRRRRGRRQGIIPACAGSTVHVGDDQVHGGDHPRMCGEHYEFSRSTLSIEGSSPHVRGALINRITHVSNLGIIPACAGSTQPRPCTRKRCRDHPRMCGEHICSGSYVITVPGSSPHVRGARCSVQSVSVASGIIPACAGSTSTTRERRCRPRDHPRMCGEHSPTLAAGLNTMGSSPHVRGAQSAEYSRLILTGIIPACAGSTIRRQALDLAVWDHPRMCGEHPSISDQDIQSQGSSPHVRGARRARVVCLR